jgi:hypothetical protein
MRTAVDIVLEGVSNGSITQEDAKILLEAIHQKGGTTFVPVPSEPHPPLNPYNPPYKQPDIWYTTGTTTTSDNKSDING